MDNPSRTFTFQVVIQMLFFIVLIPLLPLIISGQWSWWQAWAFALVSILGFVISRALVRRRHPDLLAERARFLKHEDAKPWDKVLRRSLDWAAVCCRWLPGWKPAWFGPPPLHCGSAFFH